MFLYVHGTRVGLVFDPYHNNHRTYIRVILCVRYTVSPLPSPSPSALATKICCCRFCPAFLQCSPHPDQAAGAGAFTATPSPPSPRFSSNVGTSGGYAVYEDRATFYTALSEFVEDGENARFLSDVVFNEDGTILVSHDKSRH